MKWGTRNHANPRELIREDLCNSSFFPRLSRVCNHEGALKGKQDLAVRVRPMVSGDPGAQQPHKPLPFVIVIQCFEKRT